MSKLKSQLAPPGEEALQLHRPYIILNVEEFKSDVFGFLGLRLTLDGGGTSDSIIAIPLWTRDVVGKQSKLGSFIDLLGDETDDWIGEAIQFDAWSPKNRQVSLVSVPKAKAKKE